MGEILPSTVKKCCFRYDLVIGCAVYVTMEVYLWAILSIASIYTEFKLIENRDSGAFQNFTKNSTYYVTAFGNPSDHITRAIICKFTETFMKVFMGRSGKKNSGKVIDFLPVRSYTNCRQRVSRCGICALLYLRCDSFDWDF